MALQILCYHKVGPVSTEGRFLNIEPEVFASHVRYFARRRWRFVTANDLSWRKSVWLTFDDAYASALDNALPVMREAGVLGTFYAVTGLVGKTSEWDGRLARPLADWDVLEEAAAAGFEIGNHTHMHPSLSGLSANRQAEEILEARRVFESRGFKTQSVCYPYGDVGPETLGVVAAAGYEIGVGLGKRTARETDDPLSLPRVVVAYSDKLPKLLYKMYIRPYLP